MAAAPEYSRTKNFLDNNPDRTDHSAINNELDAVAVSINALRDNAALLQNDDGTLKNALVTVAALSTEVLNLMTGTDVLTIEGPKGDVGASFAANYKGLEVERPTFATQPKGFSFLAMDTGLLYFKLSDDSGDWSTGYEFGKGDQGDPGAAGPAGADGVDGVDGVVTLVDDSIVTVGLTGKTSLSIRLVETAGTLAVLVSTV